MDAVRCCRYDAHCAARRPGWPQARTRPPTRGCGPSGRTDPVSTGRVASRRLHRRPVASVALAGRYWPASDPPMPPTLKYLFNSTKMATGGIIATTATAITEPQSVVFCWKND